MKKILTLGALVLVGGLSACRHDPNWSYDCTRNYSEDPATHSACKARVAQATQNPHDATGASGQMGLRPDISGPRAGAEIGHGGQSF